MGVAERVREFLRRLEERFRGGRRRGVVLTLLALARLEERGERATPERVAEEGRRIMREYPGDWGVEYEEYTPGFVSEVLRELEDMGVVERLPDGGYRLAREEGYDPVADVYARFGYLIFYGGPAR